MPSTTREQLLGTSIGYRTASPGAVGTLVPVQRATYQTYRAIRRHPTVALARAFAIAPIVAAGVSYKSDEDVSNDVVEFVRKAMDPLMPRLLQASIENRIDYGWSPWEVIWNTRGRWYPKRMKQLLVDNTEIAVQHLQAPEPGRYAGLFNIPWSGEEVYVPPHRAFVVAWGVEGDYHYGEPLLENARVAFADWENAKIAAERYAMKIAGGQLVLRYPIGTSKVKGEDVDNATLADNIITSLEAAGVIKVPTRKRPTTAAAANAEDAKDEWGFEWVTPSTNAAADMSVMLRYDDSLLIRALLIPERAVVEGQFGTKAEAGVHADVAVIIRQNEFSHLIDELNRQVVDRIMAWNFGMKSVGTVGIEPNKLSDQSIAFISQVFQAMITNPLSATDVTSKLDLDAITDKLGVPKIDEVIDPVSPESGAMKDAIDSQLRRMASTNGDIRREPEGVSR